MKKYFIYTCLLIVAYAFTSCDNDESIDRKNSIFNIEETEPNEFDKWLLSNYVYPYNVQVKYRMEDIETDPKYDLVPADYDKAIALMKIVKHVWFEAYDELWGINLTRAYVPKLITLIGNVAYTESGMILGQAEGGLKVSLFQVNTIDVNNLNTNMLNEYYFKTMHHEFAHILNQKKPYDTSFNRISESSYVGSSWYQTSVTNALKKGFISNYAMDRATEDFVELISIYVTNTESVWESKLVTAGEIGRPIIEQKFDIVYDYMKESWGVDLDELRYIVQRRQSEIFDLDLSTL